MNTRLLTTAMLTTLTTLTFTATSAWAQSDEDVPPPPPPPVAAEDAPADEPDAPSDAPYARARRYFLKDGQVLIGYGNNMGDSIEVELMDGTKLMIPKSSIDYTTKLDDGPRNREARTTHRTTHRTRYLYSPSGMMLKEGEGYISQKELLFTSFAYGVTDNFSVIVGGAVPTWFVSFPSTLNIIGGVKVGGEIAEDVHMSAGAEAVFLPGLAGLGVGIPFGGLAFGNITLGDPTAHLTLNVALPFFSAGGQGGISTQIVTTTLSGYYQFTDGFGLVTENWWTFAPGDVGDFGLIFNSLAGRFHTGDFTIDTGFILTGGYDSFSDFQYFPFPLPWIDFSWSFGG